MEEAIADWDRTLELKPDLHEAFYYKASCYALDSQIDRAIQNLQQAINLNPDELQEMAKTDSGFDSIRSHTRFEPKRGRVYEIVGLRELLLGLTRPYIWVFSGL